MPKYRFGCPVCGNWRDVVRPFSRFDDPEYCFKDHYGDGRIQGGVLMVHIFTAEFQIIAHREQDKRENKLYDILTKGGTESDKLQLYKQDMARQEATMIAMPDVPKEFTTEDILNTGICEAARSGDVGIANWRKEHIPVKTYKEGEAITA